MRLADRLRSGRSRVTSRRQDRAIRLAHLRNRHLTTTETALNSVGTLNRRISKRKKLYEIDCMRVIACLSSARWSTLDSGTSVASYGVVNSPCTQAMSNEAVETSLFTDELRFTLFRSNCQRGVHRRRRERFADACVDKCYRFGGWLHMV